MASEPLIAVDELIAPIPGDIAAGEPVPFEDREKLEELRKEESPEDYAPDDPMRPESFRKADWGAIIRTSKEILERKSKDLLTSARLMEALVKKNGFAGLRDGLRLIQGLIDQAWDRLNPVIETEDDMELRAGPFNWIDDPDRGARFPSTLRTVPMVDGEEGNHYGWVDWKLSQDGKGKVTREQFDKAIHLTALEKVQANLDDLNAASQALQGLTQSLGAKMGAVAPGLTGLRQALEECRTLAQQIMKIKAPAGHDGDDEAAGGETGTGGGGGTRRPAGSREEAYRQLAQAAAVLQQLEPHSPIPYLVQRACALGALPFPQMIKALIREPNVLSELARELGIKEEEPPS
jgi:type VI secretion system ImpA family protein